MKIILFLIIIIFCSSINAGSILLLNNGIESLKYRLHAIDQAKDEIIINYYIVADDETSYLFFKKVLDVKEKNPQLKVYMVFDGQGSTLNRSFVGYLKSKGIEIKVFHPFPYFKKDSWDEIIESVNNLNRRSHEKFIVIDGKILISGGRNLSEKYFDLSYQNFHDLDFFSLSRKLASETRNYFVSLWKSDYLLEYKTPNLENNHKLIRKFEEKMLRSVNLLIKELYKVKDTTYTTLSKKPIIFQESNAYLISSFNKENNSFDPLILKDKIFDLINSKEIKQLKIISPYFLPDSDFTDLLISLRKENVNIEIVTNSTCSSDVKLATGASSTKKKILLEHGVRIYEYIGPSHLHAKVILINDETALIGTLNITPRSFRYNNEMMYVFKDIQVANQVNERIKIDISNSLETKLINNKVNSFCDQQAIDDPFFKLGRKISFVPFFYKYL